MVGAVLRTLVADMPLAVPLVVPVSLKRPSRGPLQTLMLMVPPQAPALAVYVELDVEELAMGASPFGPGPVISPLVVLPLMVSLPSLLLSEKAAHRLAFVRMLLSVLGRLIVLRLLKRLPVFPRQLWVMATLELFTLLLTNSMMPPVSPPLTAVTCRVVLRPVSLVIDPLPGSQALPVVLIVNVGVVSVLSAVTEVTVVMVSAKVPRPFTASFLLT